MQTFKCAFNRSWISVLQMNEEIFNFLFISSGVSPYTLYFCLNWCAFNLLGASHVCFPICLPSLAVFSNNLPVYKTGKSFSKEKELCYNLALYCCVAFEKRGLFPFLFFSSCHISCLWKLVCYLLSCSTALWCYMLILFPFWLDSIKLIFFYFYFSSLLSLCLLPCFSGVNSCLKELKK